MNLVEDALERVRRRYLFAVAGYVVMPEHVHLLINEPQRGLLSTVIQALKLSVSIRSRQRPFWRAHSYDFNVSAHKKFVATGIRSTAGWSQSPRTGGVRATGTTKQAFGERWRSNRRVQPAREAGNCPNGCASATLPHPLPSPKSEGPGAPSNYPSSRPGPPATNPIVIVRGGARRI
jgi:REP element-mobilizing transposase RayT